MLIQLVQGGKYRPGQTVLAAQGALFGAAGAGDGTYFGDLVSKQLKDMPSYVVIPYFQTPATITVTLPSAGVVGNNVDTVIQNVPAFVPSPEIESIIDENKEEAGNGE
ncbi:hypothetical protein [Idiomarina sp.]|uniref:hypothetical protein n=1 Tax=Idiomarina sp. TaxID=1874361 RepID=UPI003A91B986